MGFLEKNGVFRAVMAMVLMMSFTAVVSAGDWVVNELFPPKVCRDSIGYFALDHQNKPGMAIASIDNLMELPETGLLRFASHDGASWQFETVDDDALFYHGAALAFDSQDNPNIVCEQDGQLRHYYREAGLWESELIADGDYMSWIEMNFCFDSQDRPHIIYSRNSEVMHGVKLGSDWTIQSIGSTDDWPRAIMGDDDVLRVVFTGITDPIHEIYYATIDASGSVLDIESTSIGEWPCGLSIALDEANIPHIAYVDQGAVHYAYRDDRSWRSELIESSEWNYKTSIVVDQATVHIFYRKGYGFVHVFQESQQWQSEILDENLYPMDIKVKVGDPGNLHIAYISAIEGQDRPGELIYGVRNAVSWDSEFVECSYDPGFLASLALDQSGFLHICHVFSSLYSVVHLGYMTNKDDEWISTVADAIQPRESVIAINSNDQPVIAFSDGENLRFGSSISGQWNFQTLDTGERIAGLDMDVNANGLVGISYYHESELGGTVRYVFSSGGAWVVESLGSASMNSYEALTRVAVDQSGIASISYYTITTPGICELYFGQRLNPAWVIEKIDRPYISDYGRYDMGLDHQDRIFIAYPHYSSTIYFLSRTESGWTQQTIPTGEYDPSNVSLAFDIYDNPYIAAAGGWEPQYNRITYVYRYNGNWNLNHIQLSGDPHEPFDIQTVIDPDNRMHVISKGSTYGGFIHASSLLSPPTTPTPTPTPTPNLPPVPGVTLDMPAHYFYPGDTCYLNAVLKSDSQAPIQTRLFVILQIESSFWFYPDWTQDVSFENIAVSYGSTDRMILPEFTWPDTGSDTVDGINFWGAMLNETMTDVIGGMEGIGNWTFGFGPN